MLLSVVKDRHRFHFFGTILDMKSVASGTYPSVFFIPEILTLIP